MNITGFKEEVRLQISKISSVQYSSDIKKILSVEDRQRIYPIYAKEVIDYVSEITGISREAILSKSRKHEVIIARQIAQWTLRNRFGLTTMGIGKEFGRDHATVVNSIKMVDKMIFIKYKPYTEVINILQFKQWEN